MTAHDKLDAETSAYLDILVDLDRRLDELAGRSDEGLTPEERIAADIYRREYERLQAVIAHNFRL
jgi:hypothetical protein